MKANSHQLGVVAVVWRRWGGWIIAAVLAALVAAGLWHLLSDTASQRREAPTTALLTLPPPPPPPPPPEPEKLPEPEPEKTPKLTDPTPSPDKPADKPAEDKAPDPARDLADPVTINGDAQAGNDAFGVQAGQGGGRSGVGSGGGTGGLGSGSYARYVSARLQQALQRDSRTRHLAFEDLRLDLWLSADGRATRVELVRGSGNALVDEGVLKVLHELDALDERPPASMRYPIRVAIRGVRP